MIQHYSLLFIDVLKELLQPEVAVEQIAAAHSVRRAPHSCS